jgi:hypothetical protein
VKKAEWRRGKPYLFCKDGVFELHDDQFQEELCRPDVM